MEVRLKLIGGGWKSQEGHEGKQRVFHRYLVACLLELQVWPLCLMRVETFGVDLQEIERFCHCDNAGQG